jgi:hypothetical protein
MEFSDMSVDHRLPIICRDPKKGMLGRNSRHFFESLRIVPWLAGVFPVGRADLVVTLGRLAGLFKLCELSLLPDDPLVLALHNIAELLYGAGDA